MTNIELKCGGCGHFFFKKRNEYNRRLRLGSAVFYCSRTCSGKINKENMRQWLDAPGKVAHLRRGRETDEHSPFRYFLRKIRSRHKKKGWKTDLTLSYLKQLWEKQNGKCPFTGWDMVLPKNTIEWDKSPATPKHASLDRIEAKTPYVKGNVRFVSYMGNLCKHAFTDEDVKIFAKAVARNDK